MEKLWNLCKTAVPMEKLWNLSKTAVPMEKLWNFRFGGKKCVLSLVQTSKCSFNVCCFGYHFTRLSSKNLPGYTASFGRVNTC